ncbi:hypothetical protein MARINOS108_60002 [Marinoscillum sp. 108]|nr:hypothetical protein MARINOS108_60002 [Marinoscillum sp. 108]
MKKDIISQSMYFAKKCPYNYESLIFKPIRMRYIMNMLLSRAAGEWFYTFYQPKNDTYAKKQTNSNPLRLVAIQSGGNCAADHQWYCEGPGW